MAHLAVGTQQRVGLSLDEDPGRMLTSHAPLETRTNPTPHQSPPPAISLYRFSVIPIRLVLIQSIFYGVADEVGGVAEVEFAEEVSAVGFGGVFADE